MKYLSLFSGIGGFELGIQQAYEDYQIREQEPIGKRTEWNKIQQSGDSSNTIISGEESQQEQRHRLGEWLCIGYSEIDKYAIQIYDKHFPEHKNHGDITSLDPTTLPDFDFLCGGFPCQAFSIAGKRRGFDDTRGTLFFDIARILKEKRPRLFLLENVKGLLSHDNGNTFKTIISTLDELGYDLQWQVLNSKNFGVPQNRERVFIIGHLRGTSRPKVFPIIGKAQVSIQPHKEFKYFNRCGKAVTPDGISGTIVRSYDDTSGESTKIIQLNNPTHSNNRVYGEDGISPSLNTMQGGNRQPKIVIPILTPDRLNKRQNGRRFKENGDPSFTLTSQDKHGIMLDEMKIRRLTPKECERLQGFPDNWTEGVSDTQRYKVLGNAVTVNVIKEIVKRIISSN